MAFMQKQRRNYSLLFIIIPLLFYSAGCHKENSRKEKVDSEISITIIPREGQKIRDSHFPIRIYFSRAVPLESLSYKLNPPAGDLSISLGMDGRLAEINHSDPFDPGQSYEFEVQIELDEVKKFTASVHFDAVGLSSLQLISRDEEKGLLDIDTAWIYRFQSLFEPHKLSPEYESPTPIKCGTPVLRSYMLNKDILHSSTIELLRPYLVRPNHPESVFFSFIEADLRKGQEKGFSLFPSAFAQTKRPVGKKWEFEFTSDRKIKVWSYHSHEHAQSEAERIEGYSMYQKIKNLIGRETVSDAGEKDGNGESNDGGDEALDIYFVPGKMLGLDAGACVPIKDTKITPSWIMINESLSGEELVATLAHEIFHAFQDACDSHEDEWWAEATATWAEDFIAPLFNTEQENLPFAFFVPQNRLETITEIDGAHEYGIYLFPFYMAQEFGEKTIGDIWAACENLDSLDSIDMKLEKGFDESFKEFSLFNSDIGPYKGKYQDVSGSLKIYEDHGEKEVELKSREPVISVPPKEEGKVDIDLPPLSAKYIRVKNNIDKELTPHVRFDLSDFIANPKVTIQVIIEPEGIAVYEDWSGLDEREFCINNQDEDFEDMTLVVASAERESPVFPVLKIFLDAEGCLEGDAVVTIRKKFNETYEHFERLENGWEQQKSNRSEKASVNASFTLERSVYYPWRDPPEIVEFYKLVSWNLVSGTATMFRNREWERRHEEYHKGIEEKGTYILREKGRVIRMASDQSDIKYMSIVLDAESKKAKEVTLPSFSLRIYWHGTWKEVWVLGDQRWDPFQGKFRGSRTETFNGETEHSNGFHVGSVYGSGKKVVSGNRTTILQGKYRVSQIHPEGQRQEWETEWKVVRREPQKKK
jgi:hypothetical protein